MSEKIAWSELEKPLDRLMWYSGDAYTKMFIPTVAFDVDKIKEDMSVSKNIMLTEMVI